MLIVSIVLSIAMLLTCNICSRQKDRPRHLKAACGAFAWLFLGCCFASPLLLVNCCLVGVLGLICAASHVRWSAFLVGSILITIGTYGYFGYSAHEHSAELREKYPVESLDHRLLYETRANHAATRLGSSNDLTAAQDLAAPSTARNSSHLTILETQVDQDSYRSHLLARVHDDHVSDFINSPGFGIGRGIGPIESRIDLRSADPGPISLPPPDSRSASASWEQPPPTQEQQAANANSSGMAPSQDQLSDMHDHSILDFVNSKGFGFIKNHRRVAGFRSHRFTQLPEVLVPDKQPELWKIQRVELVSLLKFDEPAVYLSTNLPRMDELRDAKTRPLNAFEKEALKGLRGTDELSFHQSGEEMQIVGAIRALTQCLKCHDVERGELLGAFSYRLRRETAVK